MAKHLKQAGVLLQLDEKKKDEVSNVPRGKVRWNSPYGFRYEKGKPQKHPQEFEILQIILNLKDAGKNSREIAEYLNAQRFRPRLAGRWDRYTIYQILKWHETNPNFMREVLKWDSNNLFN